MAAVWLMAGYSGTPFVKKLGIKPGTTVLTIGAPSDYRAWLGDVPGGVRFVTRSPKAGADIVHLFVTSIAELDEQLARTRVAMRADGALWVSWYKKSAKIATDVTEDAIRSRALKTDLVDVKVCAVTDVWSGLKLVVRKHLR
jgi:hypothetical protein